MNEKQFDKAIESFNLVKEEDKEWLDSAKSRKNNSILFLIKTNDWKKITRTLDKNKDDDDFFEYSTEQVEKYLTEKCTKGKSDSVLMVMDQYRIRLESLVDTNLTKKIIGIAEDNLFTGVWVGEGSLKDQEIVFKRKGNALNGLSNKSLNGWTENMIIYKNLSYQDHMLWKVNPKIFSMNYYYESTTTYYAKKGTLSFISKDTLQLDYESLGKINRFHREQ
jgi:hypothetical protein